MVLKVLGIIAVICAILGGTFARHHHDSEEKEKPIECPNNRIDGVSQSLVPMLCKFGCCGKLEAPRCCEESEKGESKDEQDEQGIDKGVVVGLGIFAGVMLVLAVACCGCAINKHMKAKQRRTTPTVSTVPIPFSSGKPSMPVDTKTPMPVEDKDTDNSLYTVQAPPRYETITKRNTLLPPLNYSPKPRPDALLEMGNPPPYMFPTAPVNSTLPASK